VELENPIKLDENALLQIVDKSFSYARSIITDLEPIAIRILDISTQSIVQSRDISGFNNPQTFGIGKLLDIGICRQIFEGDITYIRDSTARYQPNSFIFNTRNIKYFRNTR